MNTIKGLLIRKVKEPYIAKYILDSIDDYEIQLKHKLIMKDIKERIVIRYENCLYGYKHSFHQYYLRDRIQTKIYHLNNPTYINSAEPFLHISGETFYYNTGTTISENRTLKY